MQPPTAESDDDEEMEASLKIEADTCKEVVLCRNRIEGRILCTQSQYDFQAF